jgi:hypothetical protein
VVWCGVAWCGVGMLDVDVVDDCERKFKRINTNEQRTRGFF